MGFVGYRVGGSGEIGSVRRRILDCVFFKKLPNVESKEYMNQWGAPETATRLKKMAEAIAAFARNAKNKKSGNYSSAISDWEADLEHLRKQYYAGRFHFDWPRTSI